MPGPLVRDIVPQDLRNETSVVDDAMSLRAAALMSANP